MSHKCAFFCGLPLASEDTLDATEEVLLDQEAGVLIDEALAPPRLPYAVKRGDHVEVKYVELPGVRREPLSRREERVWTYRELGIEIPLPDHEARVWTEETEDGMVVPLGAGHILDWARERARRVLQSDRAVEVLGVAGLTMPVFLSALAGQGDLAMVQAHGAGLMMCIVQMARLIRG